jgi:hypothetical protein
MARLSCVAAALILLPSLSACTTWTRSPEVAPVLEQLKARPQSTRVTLNDGAVVTFRSPIIRGDSLLEGDRIHGSGRTVAVSQIREVETKDVKEGQTFLIGAGAVVALVVFAFIVAWGNYQPG